MSEEHHRLFDIPEILSEIVEHFAGLYPSGRPDSGTLTSLAVCCKAFSAPALDALWKTLFSALPLFKLLPGFQKVDNVWVC
jgi:hypothetical protein